MIIQQNTLEKWQQPVKREGGREQNFSSRRKLTLEERTLKKIAQLKENNSMLIDCNVLAGDEKFQSGINAQHLIT